MGMGGDTEEEIPPTCQYRGKPLNNLAKKIDVCAFNNQGLHPKKAYYNRTL